MKKIALILITGLLAEAYGNGAEALKADSPLVLVPSNPSKCKLEKGAGPDGADAYVVYGDPKSKAKGYLTWSCPRVEYSPGTWYGVAVDVNRESCGSEVIFDNAFHRELRSSYLRRGWHQFKTCFRTFDGTNAIVDAYRIQEYNSQGRTAFANPRLVELRPEWRREAGLELGAGEMAIGNRYTFNNDLKNPLSSCQRPFLYATMGARTGYKLDATGTCEYVYRFTLGNRSWLSASVVVAPTELVGPVKIVEFSNDGGKSWVQVGAMTDARDHEFTLPPELFPCRELTMRIRMIGADGKSRVQFRQIALEAMFDGAPVRLAGATRVYEKASGRLFLEDSARDYLTETFGAQLPASSHSLKVWAASSGRKVMRDAAVPVASTERILFQTSANEAESAQLVFTPTEDIFDIRVSVKKFDLPGTTMQILWERYHRVTLTTDQRGVSGWWPDALMPQDSDRLAVKGGESQPFFLRVKPPKDAKKGIYNGTLEVRYVGIDGQKTLDVPFAVEVFGFCFPERLSLATTFGLNMGVVANYHKAKSEADRRTLLRKYLKFLADSHIATHPITLAKPTLKWTNQNDPNGVKLEIDWTEFDRDMTEFYDGLKLNNFRFRIEGIGYSDHDNLHEPVIAGVKRGNPQYERLMGMYLTEVQRHLEKKGWIDGVWVQTFDEPTSQHFEYVRWQNSLVERYAPKLRRLMTPTDGPNLAISGINIWCPVPYHLHTEDLPKCRTRGDDIWWYICCSPPGTWAGMHIDHPGVDLRVWSWQSWDENVTGLLYWMVNWWTGRSGYADPQRPQNPYLDPAGWGKRAKPLSRAHVWGNGEGRFIYPPVACADARQSETVLDGPNSSYRLELLREGIEDYEYFAMLKRLDPSNRLLKVPESVTRRLDDYSTDPTAMEGHRIKMAREIERLKQGSRDVGHDER